MSHAITLSLSLPVFVSRSTVSTLMTLSNLQYYYYYYTVCTVHQPGCGTTRHLARFRPPVPQGHGRTLLFTNFVVSEEEKSKNNNNGFFFSFFFFPIFHKTPIPSSFHYCDFSMSSEETRSKMCIIWFSAARGLKEASFQAWQEWHGERRRYVQGGASSRQRENSSEKHLN